MSLHSLSLAEILEEHRRSRPAQAAAIACDGTTLTYPELADRVTRLANAYEDAGVRAGDRILWLAQNDVGVLEGIVAAS